MKNTQNKVPTENDRMEEMARTLGESASYHVLRHVPKPFAIIADDMPKNGRIVAIIDTETTGLHPEIDSVIELSIQLLVVDKNGEVIGHTEPDSWLQDPGEPLDPKIVMVTGLTDADLAGPKIDVEYATKLLKRADLIIAHNAHFDAQFVEELLPEIQGKPWGVLLL